MKIGLPKYKVHNRFDIVVQDCRTKIIEKEVTAYNTALPNNVTELFLSISSVNRNIRGIDAIAIGRGSGTPSSEDTALFSQIANIDCERVEMERSFPLTTAKYKTTLSELSYVGETITELGIVGSVETSTSGAKASYLLSHALLVDSEGNPISIGPKTDTQIIDIYATVYIEMLDELGEGFSWHPLNVFNMGLTATMLLPYDREYISVPAASQIIFLPQNVSKAGNYSRNANIVTYTPPRLLSTEGNNYPDIYAIELTNHGIMSFPNEHFPIMTFSDKQIGVGDGTNQYFNLLTGFFVPNSETIKIDGVTQTRDVDYSIQQGGDYFLNITDIILPHCPQVKATLGSLDGPKYDVNCLGGLNAIAPYTDEQYIYIDLGSERLINRVMAVRGQTYNVSLQLYKSHNKIDWELITNFTADSTSSIFPFDATQARYLKITSTSASNRYINNLRIYGTKSIFFTSPPSADAAITASWQTDVPPKSSDYSYDVSLSVDWG